MGFLPPGEYGKLGHVTTVYRCEYTPCGRSSDASLVYEKTPLREKVSGLNWYAVMGPSLCTWYAPPRRSTETAGFQGMQASPIWMQLGLSCTRSYTHGRTT